MASSVCNGYTVKPKEITFGTKKKWSDKIGDLLIFYDRTNQIRKRWAFNTGECLIEVTAWSGLTVFYRYFKLYFLFQYLQNCSVILIATEISRACSSKTAKHLFDENFRRQLLMDGQYGNIVFVCTKNDVLTPTELIRYFNNKFLYGSLSYYFVNLNLRFFLKTRIFVFYW
jgi:hypothetical protein